MYSAIRDEFMPRFKKIELDYSTEYYKAAAQVPSGTPDKEAIIIIKKVLGDVLLQYYQSKPTTRAGRVLRWLSRIAAIILPSVKTRNEQKIH